MAIGSLSSLLLKSPSKVIRTDGSLVEFQVDSNVFSELVEIVKLFKDWRVICLFPAFFTSNFFYAYQFNAVNGKMFNLRTRGLNNVFYWGMQMIASFLFSIFILDMKDWNRKKRAWTGLTILVFTSIIVWILGIFFQLEFRRSDANLGLDFMDSVHSWHPILVYSLYGLLDAIYQNYIYWLVGSLSNNGSELARLVGCYKSVQSVGSALSWRIDAIGTDYFTQVILNWVLMLFSFPFLFLVTRRLLD